MNEHILVITGSAPLPDHVVEQLPGGAIVLAADGGLDIARAAGLTPSGLIGDLDSVSSEGAEWAAAHTTISRHDPDKDRTDTELALYFAARMNPARLTLVGGGDRLDHTIAALGALGAPQLTSVPHLDGWWNGQHLTVLHGPGRMQLSLIPGSTLSLIALHGPCTGVTLDGVRWPLNNSTLHPVVGRGVSNEVLPAPGTAVDGRTGASTATAVGSVDVTVTAGVLTLFDVPAPAPT